MLRKVSGCRPLISCFPQVKSILPRLVIRASENGKELAGLCPAHCRHRWPMLEDVFGSPAVRKLEDRLISAMLARDEWTTISIDATCRVCFRLMGRAPWRAPAAERARAASDDSSSKRRVLTVRGRTGFVTLMKPMPNEQDKTVASTIQTNLRASCRDQTRFVFCDDPSAKLHDCLRQVLPNMEALCLDTTHLAMVYEYATWSKPFRETKS